VCRNNSKITIKSEETGMDHGEPGNKRNYNEFEINKIYPGETAVKPQLPLWYIKSKNTIWYILSVIEVLLLLRFIFKLLGANTASGFTIFLYSITNILTAPFSGIFNPVRSAGLVTTSVFEPATIIAMAIYALAAWGIIRLLWIKVSRDGS